MKKKRWLSLTLAVCMLLGSAAALPKSTLAESTSVTASAESAPTSGKCGKNVNWTLDSDGVLTISGKGKMDDYVSNTSPFYNRNDIISVVIKSGVTSIGSTAFYECDNLTSVTIPNSVTSIGVGVFVHCSSLASITIPSSITSIDKGAFFGCTSLKSVTIPGSVTSIGEQAFLGCFSLTSIIIPNSVNSIGELAFYDCYRLTSVTIPQSVTQIGKEALGYTYGVKVDGFTICAKKGTAAEKYAKDNGFKFVEIKLPKATRLAGAGRYATAVEISKAGFPSGSDTVILAYSMNYADALAGVPLAAAKNAPILLTNTKTLDADTLAEIKRLSAKNVIILGGEIAISKQVENNLVKSGIKASNIKRIAGANRYSTATFIGEQLNTNPTDVFFVYGQNYADALSVSTVAALKKAPIIYLTTSGELNADTAKYLAQLKKTGSVKNAYVIGGTSVISDDMADKAAKALGLEKATRVAGADRFSTCVAVNEKFADVLDGDMLCVATGMDFPDALAGGVYAALNNAPLFLINGKLKTSNLNDKQKAYLIEKKPSSITAFGGTSVVPDDHIADIAKNSI
ncbi:MAG: cell wall-binding repeat-containing protein [Ruminococcus sp.]|nr:cell wall-binding repeat-containing protein [Ruminococcus sp.]